MVPALTSVAPASGPSGGLTLVELRGSGFRLPPAPAPSGPAPAPGPSVEVLIGGRAAAGVRVFDAGRLTAVTPAHAPATVDVVIRNLDEAGVPIPGEEATLPGAFVYALPNLALESDLTRLVRALLQTLKAQVLPSVTLTVQTDFNPDTGEEVSMALAPLPALVLVGPELVEDRFYSVNQLPEAPDGARGFTRRSVPYTVDLGFSIVGTSDHTTELLNLLAATQLFFHRNKFVELDRDPGNASAGRVRYEMDLTTDGDLRVTSQPNESNVRSFSGRFVIRGFDLEGLTGFEGEGLRERGHVAEEIVIGPAERVHASSDEEGE